MPRWPACNSEESKGDDATQSVQLAMFGGDFVSVGRTKNLGLTHSSYTIEAWVHLREINTANQGDNTLLGADHLARGVTLHALFRNGCPHLGHFYDDLDCATPVAVKEWHHVAFVFSFSEKTQTIYLDGHNKATRAATPLSGDCLLSLNRYAGGRPLNGWVRGFRVWKTARSCSEIRQFLSRTVTLAQQPELVCSWADGASRQANGTISPWNIDSWAEDAVTLEAFPPRDLGFAGEAKPKLSKGHVDAADGPAPVAGAGSGAGDGSGSATPAEPEQALRLMQAQQYLGIGTSGDLGIVKSSYTVEAWINLELPGPTSVQSDNIIVGTDMTEKYKGLHITVRGMYLHFGHYCADTTATVPLNLNCWVHIACVYDCASRTQLLYKDGVLVGEGKDKHPLSGSAPLNISRFAGGRPLLGKLCEFRIWSVARTVAQIKDTMKKKILLDGRGDDGTLVASQSSMASKVGSVQHSWIVNGAPHLEKVPGVVLQGPPLPPIRRTATEVVGARWFHPEDGTYILGSTEGLGMIKGSYTVEAWIKINEFAQDQQRDNTIVGVASPCHPYQAMHFVVRAGSLYFGHYCDDTQSHVPVPLNEWCHVACVYDHRIQQQTIFMGGKVVATGKGKGPLTTSADLWISQYAEGRSLRGFMCELRIWNHARRGDQIMSCMKLQYPTLDGPGDTRGLVACWSTATSVLHGERKKWRLRGDEPDIQEGPPLETEANAFSEVAAGLASAERAKALVAMISSATDPAVVRSALTQLEALITERESLGVESQLVKREELIELLHRKMETMPDWPEDLAAVVGRLLRKLMP